MNLRCTKRRWRIPEIDERATSTSGSFAVVILLPGSLCPIPTSRFQVDKNRISQRAKIGSRNWYKVVVQTFLASKTEKTVGYNVLKNKAPDFQTIYF